jgi:hypothetical protein
MYLDIGGFKAASAQSQLVTLVKTFGCRDRPMPQGGCEVTD